MPGSAGEDLGDADRQRHRARRAPAQIFADGDHHERRDPRRREAELGELGRRDVDGEVVGLVRGRQAATSEVTPTSPSRSIAP